MRTKIKKNIHVLGGSGVEGAIIKVDPYIFSRQRVCVVITITIYRGVF